MHTKQKSYIHAFEKKQIVQRYESEEYAKKTFFDYIWKLEKDYLLKKIISNKNIKEYNYLDFACGSGRVISYIEPFVKQSTGIDVSEEMLKIAKSKLKKSKLLKINILKEECNMEFDLITSFRFLLNAEPELRSRILDKIYLMMKPHANFVFSIQGNKLSFKYFTQLFFKLFLKRRLNQMSYYDVKELLEEHKFKVIDFVGIGLLPKPLYRLKGISPLFFLIDKWLYKTKLFSLFSYNLIFVATKND